MKKVIKNIFMTIFYFLFCFVNLIIVSLKYVISGSFVLGKIVIALFYVGMTILATNKPTVFVCILGLLSLGLLIFSIYMVKSDDGNNKYSENRAYESDEKQEIPFFAGMSLEEAKKEYRRLMKLYHPDNVNGDAEMSKRISVAYSQYCAAYGR